MRCRPKSLYAVTLIGAVASTAAFPAEQLPIAVPPALPMPLNSHAVGPGDYPAISIRLGEQGGVLLRYTIDKDGSVTGPCDLIQASGKARIDEAACTLTHRWKFTPATQNGQPVAVKIVAGIVFALSNSRNPSTPPWVDQFSDKVNTVAFQLGVQAAQAGDYFGAYQAWAKLVEHGYAPAQGTLGILYRDGNAVPQDFTEAVKWFRLGAHQGDSDSQVSLGASYFAGKGVAASPVKALAWFSIASSIAGPNSLAAQNRDRIKKVLSEAQTHEAEELADRCPKANFAECD